MDTHSYLTRQGWRGSGNALRPDGQGISRPLLVSRKPNVLGVGQKAHDAHADQWWSRAFDETLKSLNGQTTTKQAARTKVTAPTPTGTLPTRWTWNGGLYGGFVRGQALEGTMDMKQDVGGNKVDAERATKRRRLKNMADSRMEGCKKPLKLRSEQRNGNQQLSGDSEEHIPSTMMTDNTIAGVNDVPVQLSASTDPMTFFGIGVGGGDETAIRINTAAADSGMTQKSKGAEGCRNERGKRQVGEDGSMGDAAQDKQRLMEPSDLPIPKMKERKKQKKGKRRKDKQAQRLVDELTPQRD
ncbi:MAG: hypothetical protein L6R40_007381 [Gallowayella cf. fulva]|nr:MAG: hypothetical protein L6R40_007381 [Xanthomendoza cf. fulva]